MSDIEQEVFDTIRYFDIFDMPITATQIWRSLVVDRSGTGVRWHGRHAVSLGQIRAILQQSGWLKERVASKWGYYGLINSVGRKDDNMRKYVRRRLVRHALAQYKWKKARRVIRYLAPLPFVRMIGVTGSLALWQVRPQSDFDLLLIVKRGRIWTARLFLLLVSQMMGRRRKHWEGEAPDKVCLNHYITDNALMMVPPVRSLYTAMLYTHLIPVMGPGVYRRWLVANGTWMRRWLMYPMAPKLTWQQAIQVPCLVRTIKRWVEGLLLEPAGEILERAAERVQRRNILLHDEPGRGGRVAISNTELAFHPDSKEAHVLHRFAEEYGQGKLL
ncbi:MAG: hypothetical protein ABIH36_04385 [bacterium]